ncbi:hypothetical protein [Consotaella aegiceratis]|uniref:hypothetical protein n=1 Tax=Consotaella aegiceratis TaxID=3097961 RepID=UPI002F408712
MEAEHGDLFAAEAIAKVVPQVLKGGADYPADAEFSKIEFDRHDHARLGKPNLLPSVSPEQPTFLRGDGGQSTSATSHIRPDTPEPCRQPVFGPPANISSMSISP